MFVMNGLSQAWYYVPSEEQNEQPGRGIRLAADLSLNRFNLCVHNTFMTHLCSPTLYSKVVLKVLFTIIELTVGVTAHGNS